MSWPWFIYDCPSSFYQWNSNEVWYVPWRWIRLLIKSNTRNSHSQMWLIATVFYLNICISIFTCTFQELAVAKNHYLRNAQNSHGLVWKTLWSTYTSIVVMIMTVMSSALPLRQTLGYSFFPDIWDVISLQVIYG